MQRRMSQARKRDGRAPLWRSNSLTVSAECLKLLYFGLSYWSDNCSVRSLRNLYYWMGDETPAISSFPAMQIEPTTITPSHTITLTTNQTLHLYLKKLSFLSIGGIVVFFRPAVTILLVAASRILQQPSREARPYLSPHYLLQVLIFCVSARKSSRCIKNGNREVVKPCILDRKLPAVHVMVSWPREEEEREPWPWPVRVPLRTVQCNVQPWTKYLVFLYVYYKTKHMSMYDSREYLYCW